MSTLIQRNDTSLDVELKQLQAHDEAYLSLHDRIRSICAKTPNLCLGQDPTGASREGTATRFVSHLRAKTLVVRCVVTSACDGDSLLSEADPAQATAAASSMDSPTSQVAANSPKPMRSTAILCVLPLERRMCFRRLRSALEAAACAAEAAVEEAGQAPFASSLRPLGLASPEEAEDIVGCPMGMVPPIGVQPPLPVFMDASLFAAGAPRLVVAGAAHPTLKLLFKASALLQLGAEVADLSEPLQDCLSLPRGPSRKSLAETSDLVAGGDLPDEGERENVGDDGTRVAAEKEESWKVSMFPAQSIYAPAIHIVAVVAGIRRVSRELAFVDLIPPGAQLVVGETALWLSPDGSGRHVRLQLIIGRSLRDRIGAVGLAGAIKRIRVRQLLYVGGRARLEERGEQTGSTVSEPEEVRKKRTRQLENGIVDVVAETIRLLEEMYFPPDLDGGLTRAVGQPKFTSQQQAKDVRYLDFALEREGIRLVDSAEALEAFAVALASELAAKEATSCATVPAGPARSRVGLSPAGRPDADVDAWTAVPVVGVDAEWRPEVRSGSGGAHRSPVALLQLAFRRSVWLLDVQTLAQQEPLLQRAAHLLRSMFEATQLIKVGFSLDGDLKRIAATLPQALPEGACAVLELSALADVVLPWAEDTDNAAGPSKEHCGPKRLAEGLSSLCRKVLGLGLDKAQQASEWTARPLSEDQLIYAAQDAHVCVRLFDAICCRHPTLAMQPLRSVLVELAVPWCPPSATCAAPFGGRGAELARIEVGDRGAAAAGQRMRFGMQEIARWLATGSEKETSLLLSARSPSLEAEIEGAGSATMAAAALSQYRWITVCGDAKRICRFQCGAAALFFREEGNDAADGPYLQDGDVEALQSLPGPFVIFVLRCGAWHCAGRCALEPPVSWTGAQVDECKGKDELRLIDGKVLDQKTNTSDAAFADMERRDSDRNLVPCHTGEEMEDSDKSPALNSSGGATETLEKRSLLLLDFGKLSSASLSKWAATWSPPA